MVIWILTIGLALAGMLLVTATAKAGLEQESVPEALGDIGRFLGDIADTYGWYLVAAFGIVFVTVSYVFTELGKAAGSKVYAEVA